MSPYAFHARCLNVWHERWPCDTSIALFCCRRSSAAWLTGGRSSAFALGGSLMSPGSVLIDGRAVEHLQPRFDAEMRREAAFDALAELLYYLECWTTALETALLTDIVRTGWSWSSPDIPEGTRYLRISETRAREWISDVRQRIEDLHAATTSRSAYAEGPNTIATPVESVDIKKQAKTSTCEQPHLTISAESGQSEHNASPLSLQTNVQVVAAQCEWAHPVRVVGRQRCPESDGGAL
jgi:hypothetical protein